MPTNKQVAGALRAIAELYDARPDSWPADLSWSFGVAKSTGRARRIVAGLTDVTGPEPHESETTSYLIHRGRLLGHPVEVMESQDD